MDTSLNIKGDNRIWSAIESDGYEAYDRFVDLIKNVLAPCDKELAYQIEDRVNALMVDMWGTLEEEFPKK